MSEETEEPNIDELLDEKIKPIIKQTTAKFLGISADELTKDITTKLSRSPLLDFPIDTTTKFKVAKKQFKRAYIQKMLQVHLGNISEVARHAHTDRRSIHRLIKSLKINVDKIKKDLIKPYDIKRSAVSHAIEGVLDNYRDVFNTKKMEAMYENVNELSDNLLKELPEERMSIKEAEEEWEKEYFRKALAQNNHNITKTAKKIGLRYETLHRKMKSLGIV
jgi:DNA-binding NtrC family response regulator